jgi:predicted RNase H-like HicB family nuclease
MSDMKAIQFNVVFESDEDGYVVASVPSIPGCYTQGKTLEEAKSRIKQVIKLCLDEEPEYARPLPSNFIGIDTVSVNYA